MKAFRTDVEISGKKPPGRERELQAWVDSDATTNDADTFGDLNGSSKTWDQFAANEKLFGVKATFDENVYTTPLNRDAPDFKERERKATQIAKDIMGVCAPTLVSFLVDRSFLDGYQQPPRRGRAWHCR